MKITNRNGYPEALVRAVENDPYDKGDCEFSVTELLKPPRASVLAKRHWDELEEDVEDRLWSLLGQIGHGLVERAAQNDIVEKRYFGLIDGVKVSAQVDCLELARERLTDWKFTKAWSWLFKAKEGFEEWHAQMNMQLELLRQNGIDAKELKICGIFGDWTEYQAQGKPDYPQKPVLLLDIPIWPREKTVEFMRERITLHRQAKVELPECSPKERWEKPTVYAVMKEGRKSAVKLYSEPMGAQAHVGFEKSLYLEIRPGGNTRCESYCSASKFCSQFTKIKEPITAPETRSVEHV